MRWMVAIVLRCTMAGLVTIGSVVTALRGQPKSEPKGQVPRFSNPEQRPECDDSGERARPPKCSETCDSTRTTATTALPRSSTDADWLWNPNRGCWEQRQAGLHAWNPTGPTGGWLIPGNCC